MSRGQWQFSALGFTVMWRSADRDVLPYPLQTRLPKTGAAAGEVFTMNTNDIDEETPYDPWAADRRTPQQKADEFFGRTRSTLVYVAGYPGAAMDNRPQPGQGFHVMDFPDGRYLISERGSVIEARPGDTGDARGSLARLMKSAIAIYREDNEPAYRLTRIDPAASRGRVDGATERSSGVGVRRTGWLGRPDPPTALSPSLKFPRARNSYSDIQDSWRPGIHQ